jgi:biopolymer transport protein ExbB
MRDLVHTLALGGPVMVPLLICSLLSVAVIIERFLSLRRASGGVAPLVDKIRYHVLRGEGALALAACERTPGPVAEVLAAGLRGHFQNGRPEPAMEEQAMAELPHLNRWLVVLDTVVTLAPLLGLLGTITGMIRSFNIISQTGVSHPMGITAGIAEALIATATGLVIAIFTLVAYNYFVERVKRIVGEIERRSTQLANFLVATEKMAEREVAREAAVALPQ